MPHAVVTGGNRGIGLELCKELLKRGYQVTALVRHSNPELDELEVSVISNIDVTDSQALQGAVKSLSGTSVDLLICNAGIWSNESLGGIDFDQILNTLHVNSLGPLKTVEAFLPLLSSGSKVALISSRMGSISDNTSGGRYGYRMSKAALNMAGKSLALDLSSQGISVIILHPGFVRTDMTQHQGNVDPDESARGLCDRIEALRLETTGTFWHQSGEQLPW